MYEMPPNEKYDTVTETFYAITLDVIKSQCSNSSEE